MKPIVEFVSGEGSTNYCMIQMCLFSTPPKLRSPNYYGMVVCTILDSAKWQVAWQTCDSACFVGSPQLCCQSVRDGCKLMLISFCWSAYSNSLQGFPFWYARLPVGYVIEVRRNKKLSFMQGYVGLNPQWDCYPSSSWLAALALSMGTSWLKGAAALLMKNRNDAVTI